MPPRIRIGSRPSRLAIAQAEIVRSALDSIAPGLIYELIPIRTSGDRMASASLAEAGGKGLFVKELEQALAERRIDIAVHSMKDLPAALQPGFRIAAVPRREDPRDVLVSRSPGGLGGLPRAARVGTSSARRKFQALRARPDLAVSPLRGNVDSRLERLERGELDAVVLAVAGLKRLGRVAALELEHLDERQFVPSGGQGALAVEAIADAPAGGSAELEAALANLNDPRASVEAAAERAFLSGIGASCVSPVGVLATFEDAALTIIARLFSVNGSRELSDSIKAQFDPSSAPAAEIGARLARRMLDRGAAALIGPA